MKRAVFFMTIFYLLSLFFTNQFAYAKSINKDNEGFPRNLYLYLENSTNEPEYIEKQAIYVSKGENQTIVDFWITNVYMDDMQKQLDVADRFQLTSEDAVKAKYTKTHYKITNDRFISFIGVNLYDDNDQVMTGFSSGINYVWEDIIPGSYAEYYYDTVWDYLKDLGKVN